jgi:hypothetical protein
MKERIVEIGAVLGSLAWRGFGLFLFVIGGSAGMGAIATGDPFMGVLIAWGTLMIGIVGAIGYAIATTGSASVETVDQAANDAVRKFEEKKEK